MIDNIYTEDIKQLASRLDIEIIESLISMPTFTIKYDDSYKSDIRFIGVDLALKPDYSYVNGVITQTED